MYAPIPGNTYLQALVPRTPSSPEKPIPQPVEPKLSPLIRVALDATFGIRELEALRRTRYDVGVRTHIAARRRAGLPPGPVRVLSFHAREEGEFYGTAQSGGRKYGFAARVEGGRLTSFKVL
ncbi:hypothetical protein QP027_02405 [Corynebacterium breve]|uniref:Uncharacterized protein n=1 Tax=Corynebacterium breve TaxID=3049799 RepID=A0ABY8VI29_9CORY|nr:hypothetical protein [Corynebacterium breve]WIM68273.1 hypothetical protein QP027_02405 [Corynebacterium breve]